MHTGLQCGAPSPQMRRLSACTLSHVQLFATLWAVVHHGILSMGFSRQKYWYGLPFPSPRDLRSPGLEPESLMSPALAGRLFTTSATWEAPYGLKEVKQI